jgi:hypothetical protein
MKKRTTPAMEDKHMLIDNWFDRQKCITSKKRIRQHDIRYIRMISGRQFNLNS